jgi:hypothetical protein
MRARGLSGGLNGGVGDSNDITSGGEGWKEGARGFKVFGGVGCPF